MKRPITTLAVSIAVTLLGASSSEATIYVWQGANSDIDLASNWTYDGGLDAGDPATPIKGGNQIDTDSRSDDIIRFTGTYTTPQNIYTRTATTWGSIEVLDGTVNWQNDGNNQGNYSFSDAASGNPTLIVGDGDGVVAIANMNITNWNHGGGAGTKTYVINPDGTLASARGGIHRWSNGTGQDTVMRLLGGAVNINGQFIESDILSDVDDYVSFEALGSTFTFNKGLDAGRFDVSTDVTDAFGDSFRLGGSLNDGNAALNLTDNGATWTVGVVAIPEPSSIFLFALSGFWLVARRRKL